MEAIINGVQDLSTISLGMDVAGQDKNVVMHPCVKQPHIDMGSSESLKKFADFVEEKLPEKRIVNSQVKTQGRSSLKSEENISLYQKVKSKDILVSRSIVFKSAAIISGRLIFMK